MRGPEAKAVHDLRTMSDSQLIDAAKAAHENDDESRGASLRIRRVIAEARRRELPVILMKQDEKETLAERKAAAATYKQHVDALNTPPPVEPPRRRGSSYDYGFGTRW